MNLLVYLLLVKTVLLAVSAVITGGVLALFRCRDNRISQFCWGLVLLMGLLGAGIPFGLPVSFSFLFSSAAEQKNRDSLENSTAFSISNNELQKSKTSPGSPVTIQEKFSAIDCIEETRNNVEAKGFDLLFSKWTEKNSTQPVSKLVYLVLGLWGAGIVFFSLGSLFCRARILRLLHTASEPEGEYVRQWSDLCAELGIPAKRVLFRFTESSGPALVWLSLRKGVIIVPSEFWRSADHPIRDCILRHELAHWRNADLLKTSFSRVTLLIHWFNPLAYWAVRNFEESIEQRCDSLAFGQDQNGMRNFLESILTLYESTPRYTILENQFGHSDIFRRMLRLRNNSLLKKESTMKKTIITSLMILVFGFAVTLNFASDHTDRADQVPTAHISTEKISLKKSEKTAKVNNAESVSAASSVRSGIVVDENGNPISGAVIHIQYKKQLKSKENNSGYKTATTVQSDVKGRFDYSIASNLMQKNFLWKFRCEKEGYLTCEIINSHPDFKKKLTLNAGKTIYGRLIDREGKPLPNVDIHGFTQRNFPEESIFNVNKDKHELKTTSDSQGRFRLTHFEKGLTQLIMEPQEHAPRFFTCRNISGNVGDLILQKGFTPILLLLDKKGKPVKNMPVALTENNTNGNYSYTRYSVTDDKGIAKFAPVENGYFTLRINPGLSMVQYDDPVVPYNSEIGVFPCLLTDNLNYSNFIFTIQAVEGINLKIHFSEPFDTHKKNGLRYTFCDCQYKHKITRESSSLADAHVYFEKEDQPSLQNQGIIFLDNQTLLLKGIPADAKKITFNFGVNNVYQNLTLPGEKQSRPIFNNKTMIQFDKKLTEGTIEVMSADQGRELTRTNIRVIDEKGKPVDSFAVTGYYTINKEKYEQDFSQVSANDGTILGPDKIRFFMDCVSAFEKKENLLMSVSAMDVTFNPKKLRNGVYTQETLHSDLELTLFAIVKDGRQGFVRLKPDTKTPVREATIKLGHK